MQRKEKALQLFSNRCNCSQAVFAAFRVADVLDEASALRLATMFGGGVARNRSSIRNGRYLVMIAGCNDCHTKGYAFADGRIPESQWLKGDDLGWNGPWWGTTWPVNLRLLASSMSEREWMRTKYAKTRPPMPWYALRDISDRDFRDIYRYLRHLGPAGRPAPTFLPPDKIPPEPYVRYPR